MRRALLAIAAVLCAVSQAHAQNALIEIDRGRTQGFFTKVPVFQRAIVTKPAASTDTAVLFFRGWPGIARIQSVEDWARNLLPFMRLNQHLFHEAGIALVIVDCPTDEWGTPGDPTACLDSYRFSKRHADDVRSVMARLRDEHGLSNLYVMGHSVGSISSRWLATNLGNEIAGSIHSAAINAPTPRMPAGLGTSFSGFAYDKISAPVLHVHHENDACRSTPYWMVKDYAGENLVTVRGGVPAGDPCGGGHLHSYQGREELVVRAIVSWIKTRKVDRLIGE